jgi:rRNA maturation endonuclease Nob1
MNRNEKSWEYVYQNCGTPYTLKPRFCYDCGGHTVVFID